MIESIKEQIKDIHKQLDAMKQELAIKSKALIQEGAKELFAKYGDVVKSFGWVQYTPYWNDGEECRFRANLDYPRINGDYGDDFSYSSGHPNAKEIYKEIRSFTSALDQDTVQFLFGDHVSIVITPEGVAVEDYDHE